MSSFILPRIKPNWRLTAVIGLARVASLNDMDLRIGKVWSLASFEAEGGEETKLPMLQRAIPAVASFSPSLLCCRGCVRFWLPERRSIRIRSCKENCSRLSKPNFYFIFDINRKSFIFFVIRVSVKTGIRTNSAKCFISNKLWCHKLQGIELNRLNILP